jgi:hypothetical protein
MANHVLTWIFRRRREVTDFFHQDGVGDEFPKALSSVGIDWKSAAPILREIGCSFEPVDSFPSELSQSTDRLLFFCLPLQDNSEGTCSS